MSDSVKKNAADASKMLVKGAMQLFANVSATATSTPAKADSKITTESSPAPKFGSPMPLAYDGVNPEEIPREELLALCMKMNKRMQIMESKGQELVKKKGSLLSERRQLLEALMLLGVATPLSGSAAQDDTDLDVEAVLNEVSRTEEERRTDIATLLQKIAKLEDAKAASQVTSPSFTESTSEPLKSDESECADSASVTSPAPPATTAGLNDEVRIHSIIITAIDNH
jgi:hypothetical protein